MKFFIALFPIFFSLVSHAVVFTKPDTGVAVYRAGTPHFVPAATPTDVCEIYGSATKVVRVTSLEIASNQTTAGTNQIYFLKRSTANTGGNSITPTVVPVDSGKAAATAVAKYYTGANPTTGTLVGALSIKRVMTGISTSILNPVVELFMPLNQFEPVVLRGVAQGLVVNLDSITVPTGFSMSCNWTWIEE